MVRVGSNRKGQAFRFPLQKYSDEKALYTNFRYLQEYLRRLSNAIFPPFIIAPSNSVNKSLAHLVLSGDDTADEAAMIRAVSRGENHLQFLDGTITGTLHGTSASNRPQTSLIIKGMGMGITTWAVPNGRRALMVEDETDPANSDELYTSINDISYDLSSSGSGVAFASPVWRVYLHNCEFYGNTDGSVIGDGNNNSRGVIMFGCHFRDNSSTVGDDDCLEQPNGWIIANSYFVDNPTSAINLPNDCVIIGNQFRGGAGTTSIDFDSISTSDNNVITGNYFGTETVFKNFTALDNVVIGNWPSSTPVTGITLSHDNDLTDVSADDHHDEAHTVVSHSDTTATGSELETLTDGSDADALHDHAESDIDKDFFNGTLVQSPTVTIAEAAGVVTMSLTGPGTSDLTLRFSDGHTIFDATPAATIALTVGADDASPQGNYIYILKSTKALTKDTSDWPAAEHIKIAFFECPTAAFVSNNGVYSMHIWGDGREDSSGQGHMSHITERQRRMGARWFSGVSGAGGNDYITRGAGTTDFKSTAGIVYQLHRHTFDAFDTSGGDVVLVKNWNGDSWHDITDLYDITADSGGDPITNNKWFNLVFWGIANESGTYQPIVCNLPSGFYHTQSAAEQDDDGRDDFTMPIAFSNISSTGFLIARVTLQMKTGGGTWGFGSTVDLRGFSPITAKGGAAATITEFPDNTFNIHDEADESKELTFSVGGIAEATTRVVTVQDADGTMEFTGHAPESHSGTGITGAELEELSGGSATALHKHDHGGQDGLTDNDHPQYKSYAAGQGLGDKTTFGAVSTYEIWGTALTISVDPGREVVVQATVLGSLLGAANVTRAGRLRVDISVDNGSTWVTGTEQNWGSVDDATGDIRRNNITSGFTHTATPSNSVLARAMALIDGGAVTDIDFIEGVIQGHVTPT